MLDLSYIIQDMKEIKYNNKVYKLPFTVSLPEDPTAEEEVSNRFNGEKVKLPAFAVAIYDTTIGAEASEDYDLMNKGREWFQKNFTDAYYTLLDQSSICERVRDYKQ